MVRKKEILSFVLFCLMVCLGAIPAEAVISIPTDTSVGDWNSVTRIYTLNKNVTDTLQIRENNLTLDGAGFTVAGAGGGNGVYLWGYTNLNRVTNVTVKNVNIIGFYSGIYARLCNQVKLQNNSVANCARAIFLYDSDNGQVTGNAITRGTEAGIYMQDSSGNTIADNSISSSAKGIYILTGSPTNSIYHNNFLYNTVQAYSLSTGNVYNLAAPDGGNFWSNWASPDNNGDGFVDNPFVFTGGQDNLPWAHENGWSNKAPVADAGDDQAVVQIGSLIQLDGSGSFDFESDPLTYSWTILEKPAGSAAVLNNPSAVDPNFVADMHGDYVIQLIVSDPAQSSEPDTVKISFSNVKPVAVAGNNQSVIVGTTVTLNGSGSYDANLDLLTYSWQIIYKPVGSLAQLSDPNSAVTTFVPDLSGEYIISLTVSDGLESSLPSNVTVMAVTNQEMATVKLNEAVAAVGALVPAQLKSKNLAKPLTSKINEVLAMIETGSYSDAIDKLTNDILAKTDGCANEGSPDNNDWLTTCQAQGEVYPLIVEAIGYLSNI